MISAALPSWEQVKGAASGVADTVGSWLPEGGLPGPFFNPTPALPTGGFDLPTGLMDPGFFNPTPSLPPDLLGPGGLFGGGGPGPFFNPTPALPGGDFLPSMPSFGGISDLFSGIDLTM